MNKERCAVYARVSTEDQVKQYGLASQLTDLRATAKDRGYTITEEFREEGISGGTLNRPELEPLRQAVRDRRVDVVLFHDPDRLARNLAAQLILAEEFERAGVRLEFVTSSFEHTPEGKMFFQMKGVFAEYEKEKIKDRTQRGRLQKARSGHVVSSISPYGYRYLGRAQHERGRYIIVESEALVVRQMFAWLVEDGLSTREIVIRLNASGARPRRGGSRWAKSSVRRILSSPLYHGLAHYNRRQVRNGVMTWRSPAEWIPVAIPAIISEDLFVRALDRLQVNREQLSGRNTHHVYPLRGLIRCGQCGKRFAGCPSRGNRFYRCMGRDRLQNPRCGAGAIYASRIEDFVWDVVRGLIGRPALLRSKLQTFTDSLEMQAEALGVQRQQLERKLADLERRESQLLEEHLAETFDRKLIAQKAKELTSQKAGVRADLESLDRRLYQFRNVPDRDRRLQEFCDVAIRGLDRLDGTGRQQLFRHLLDEVRVTGRLVHIAGVFPGREAGTGLKARTDKGVNRTNDQHVGIGLLQPPLVHFSLDTFLDSSPSLDDIEVTV